MFTALFMQELVCFYSLFHIHFFQNSIKKHWNLKCYRKRNPEIKSQFVIIIVLHEDTHFLSIFTVEYNKIQRDHIITQITQITQDKRSLSTQTYLKDTKILQLFISTLD